MEREAEQAAAGQEGEQVKSERESGLDSDDEEVDQQQLKNGELEG